MRLILIGVAVLAGLSLVFGSFYQIQPEEVGLVLRFGRHVRTTDPGLNLKIPFVEDVLKVPVQRQLKQEFGFSTRQAQGRSRRGSQFLDESLMLTGDLNAAVVEWIVQIPNRGSLPLHVQGAPFGRGLSQPPLLLFSSA